MNLFEIRNLHCQYRPGQPVLDISRLDIPRGQLVFIIGRSGIGKSTLIETLGLMNRTIAPLKETSVLFSPGGDEPAADLASAWTEPNARLAGFRRRHFSFIFQNTNLMPNFTSGENMMVSLLIKGKKLEEARREVSAVMDRLSLPLELFDKRTTEISGGQRQRLAFVRAITAEFSVLFGDEPTGNLDKDTSETLMQVLREQIREKNKTGIIVSHDLALAEKFADMVAPITARRESDDKPPVGVVDPEHIIRRRDGRWENHLGVAIENTSAYLNQFLRFSTPQNPRS